MVKGRWWGVEWRDMKTVAIAEYHLFTSHELLQRRHLIVPPPPPLSETPWKAGSNLDGFYRPAGIE